MAIRTLTQRKHDSSRRTGATTVEYALICALVVLGLVVTIGSLGQSMANNMDQVAGNDSVLRETVDPSAGRAETKTGRNQFQLASARRVTETEEHVSEPSLVETPVVICGVACCVIVCSCFLVHYYL